MIYIKLNQYKLSNDLQQDLWNNIKLKKNLKQQNICNTQSNTEISFALV
jgi:hypothetical protein